jgi:hypothetical protein
LCPAEDKKLLCRLVAATEDTGVVNLRQALAAVRQQDIREFAVVALRSAFARKGKAGSECVGAVDPNEAMVTDNTQLLEPTLTESGTFGHVTETLQLVNSPAENECNTARGYDIYGSFLASLAGYVLEAQGNKVPSDATREAFRDAAYDLVVATGRGGGFDRSFGMNFVLPKLMLGYSASGSYLNESGPDSLRLVAQLKAFNLRWRWWYTDGGYVALNTSFVDVLNPFSELALRKRQTYERRGSVWGTMLEPSVALFAGVPRLSRHLAVSAAFSWRFYAATEDGTPRYVGTFASNTWKLGPTATVSLVYVP